MDTIIGIYIACLLGIAARTIVPYLMELKDNPEMQFDRKFLVPAIVAVIINLLAAPFVLQQLPGGTNWIAAFIFGWGMNDISRDAIKLAAGNVQALEGLK